MNESKITTYQNLWDTAKAGFREKFIAARTLLKKEEISQIKTPNFHFKELEQKGKRNPREI